MKKVLLVLSMMTVLWSCKKGDDQIQKESFKRDSTSSKNKAKVKWAADGKWDLLGFGYDVTGDVLNQESASDAPIIDMVSFERDYSQRLGFSNTGFGSQEFYSGVSALDYLKDVIKKRSWGIKGSWDASTTTTTTSTPSSPSTPYYFSASVKRNREDQQTTTYYSRYSYATFEGFRRVRRVWFTQDASPSLLVNYLTPEFVNNVATLDAESLVRRYGTHVLLDISIGGKYRLDYSSSLLKESEYTKKLRATTVGLEGGIRKILALNYDRSVSNEEINKVNTESRSRQYTLTFFGGTNSGRTISFDSEGNTSETFNIASWEQSVTSTNSALVHVDNAIPIYEFITDPVKKSQVQAAVDQYIIANQATELGEVPIYQYYSSSATGYQYFLEADRASAWWAFEDRQFHGAKPGQANAVEVFMYWNQANEDWLYGTFDQGEYYVSYLNNRRYNSQGPRFWAFKTQQPGTIPIYRHCRLSGVHFLSTTGWFPNMRNTQLAFFAYPN